MFGEIKLGGRAQLPSVEELRKGGKRDVFYDEDRDVLYTYRRFGFSKDHIAALFSDKAAKRLETKRNSAISVMSELLGDRPITDASFEKYYFPSPLENGHSDVLKSDEAVKILLKADEINDEIKAFKKDLVLLSFLHKENNNLNDNNIVVPGMTDSDAFKSLKLYINNQYSEKKNRLKGASITKMVRYITLQPDFERFKSALELQASHFTDPRKAKNDLLILFPEHEDKITNFLNKECALFYNMTEITISNVREVLSNFASELRIEILNEKYREFFAGHPDEKESLEGIEHFEYKKAMRDGYFPYKTEDYFRMLNGKIIENNKLSFKVRNERYKNSLIQRNENKDNSQKRRDSLPVFLMKYGIEKNSDGKFTILETEDVSDKITGDDYKALARIMTGFRSGTRLGFESESLQDDRGIASSINKSALVIFLNDVVGNLYFPMKDNDEPEEDDDELVYLSSEEEKNVAFKKTPEVKKFEISDVEKNLQQVDMEIVDELVNVPEFLVGRVADDVHLEKGDLMDGAIKQGDD